MNLDDTIANAIGNILERQMNKNIKPEDLLSEGKFTDFLKASALGASLCFSPMANARDFQTHELKVAELADDLIDEYNFLKKNPVLDVAGAQRLADEAFTKVCDEVQDGDEMAENTEAWKIAKATYKYLVSKDYKIATAFVAKFNHSARKLFSVQIRALPNPNT